MPNVKYIDPDNPPIGDNVVLVPFAPILQKIIDRKKARYEAWKAKQENEKQLPE